MNTQTFFTILAVVLVLIAYAVYLLLKPRKPKPKSQEYKYDVLNEQEKERLDELNLKTEKLKDLIKQEPKHTIEQATIINLKATIESLKDENQYLNRVVENKIRIINLQDIKITRLEEESLKKPTNFDFSLKVGDTIKGLPVPNGKRYVKGKITSFARRGNPKLDNGKTVYLSSASIVL
jgi:hypothetical protein